MQVSDNFMLIYKVLYGTVRGVLEHNAGLVGAIAVKESTAKVRPGGSGGVERSLQLTSMHCRAREGKTEAIGTDCLPDSRGNHSQQRI